MLVGGFQKFSLIDYPNKTSAIIFTQGCNFRCPFCHNPELVDPLQFGAPIPFEEVMTFLKKRVGLLDAVEFTGGEPTLQPDLRKSIESVRELGFLIKLDTNGSNPEILKELIENNLLDYVAMDVKAPLDEYDSAIGVQFDKETILKSISLIINSQIDYEFRTTMIKGIIKGSDSMKNIGELIKGAKAYFMQKPHFDKMLSPNFEGEVFSDDELLQFKAILQGYVASVDIR
ncbi:MAG: anaerobic ribonucleoside-triphosphate reductase activating protein [Caldisericaceae bacterium]